MGDCLWNGLYRIEKAQGLTALLVVLVSRLPTLPVSCLWCYQTGQNDAGWRQFSNHTVFTSNSQ